jgi:hypothetical protein
MSSYYVTCIVLGCIHCCSVGDCDLGGDHPPRSSSRNGNWLLYSYYGSTINWSYETCCPLGLGTSVSCLACNFALGAIFGDLGLSIVLGVYCCLGIVKVVISWIWCKTLLICHLFLKAKGVSSFSSSTNSNIVCWAHVFC